MSEQAYWELDAPWADAAVTTRDSTEGEQRVSEHQIEPGGVLRFVDDTQRGALALVTQGEVTLFRSTQERAQVVTADESVELREAHWWRNDSDGAAVVRIIRPLLAAGQ